MSHEPRPASPLRTASLMLLALAAGAGGVLWLRPAPPAVAKDAGVHKQMYQCPMHPQIILDHPGDCPICGMKLVPMAREDAPPADRGKLLFYRSPMNPSITSPTPSKDEMGMDYVPVFANDLKGEGPALPGLSTVKIDAERQQLIGLTTQPVKEAQVGGEIRTTARLAPDETRIRHIHVKVDGYVDKLYADFVGMAVKKGQPLFTFFSPDFVSAQQEYLLALKTRKALEGGSLQASGQDLLEAARKRMSLWDIPPSDLEFLERTGEVKKALMLRSPISGVVTAKTAVEGNRLTPTDTPFEITDLGQVWAIADIYEPELPRLKVGMPADLTLGAYPGKTFTGRVAFIDPQVDPKTRTTKARVELANPGALLKPEMYGEMVIRSQARKGLVVPIDAVLDSGTRKIVFVALGDGRFEPREVQTGSGLGEAIEILSGVKAGEIVVTRANFLVDSESRLKAALAQMVAK